MMKALCQRGHAQRKLALQLALNAHTHVARLATAGLRLRLQTAAHLLCRTAVEEVHVHCQRLGLEWVEFTPAKVGLDGIVDQLGNRALHTCIHTHTCTLTRS